MFVEGDLGGSQRLGAIAHGLDLPGKVARALLLGRRGLLERNTFVRYTDAVLAKVVAEGFNSKDGARSLKRWLEDNIGSLLVDTLTRSQAASMRILWLHVAGQLKIHEQALREADPIPE
ncbi:MAG: hypothetical protein KC457_06520, partial [Myxococcales bacterium]|nr:hypothetical protein [Myxococcales bacterium]